MSRRDKDKVEITAESHLGPQLGSDTIKLVQGEYDLRILSKLHPLDSIWMSYFMRKKPKKGGNFCRNFIQDMLALKNSEEGWRINKIIQFTAAAKGAPSVGELAKKPGWVGRNITQRDYKKQAEEKGATIVE